MSGETKPEENPVFAALKQVYMFEKKGQEPRDPGLLNTGVEKFINFIKNEDEDQVKSEPPTSVVTAKVADEGGVAAVDEVEVKDKDGDLAGTSVVSQGAGADGAGGADGGPPVVTAKVADEGGDAAEVAAAAVAVPLKDETVVADTDKNLPEGGRRRSKRKGRKGSRKSRKGRKGGNKQQQQSIQSQNGGRRSRRNRRKYSRRSKH